MLALNASDPQSLFLLPALHDGPFQVRGLLSQGSAQQTSTCPLCARCGRSPPLGVAYHTSKTLWVQSVGLLV